MSFKEREAKLAAKLKQLCVETPDRKWKEIKPGHSAKILHEMGLLYREKNPDKLSLIRSCALLNAALVRNPTNVETIKEDLNNLCSHLLKISKAEQSLANLKGISRKVANKVKKLRENTKDKLERLENIPVNVAKEKVKRLECNKIQTVCELQDEIASQYTSIMQFIAEKCVKIMGKPTCDFSIVGMGSLVRKEITPYSDFEHIILLDDSLKIDKGTVEYFRWFSVVFHFIILNLEETIIPCVAIPSLNDYYNKNGIDWFFDSFNNRGISLDGMIPYACKFPLGRQEGTTDKPWSTELIQPVSEMIKYLDSDVDLKNGYHLADVLKRTCFVYGNEKIHDQYCNLVQQKHKSIKTNSALFKELRKIIPMDYFVIFNPNGGKFNIKQVIYRTISHFLTIICDYHKVYSTGFQAINELEEQQIIDSKTSHHLKYALSVACEIRIKLYIKKHDQNDYIDKGKMFEFADFDPVQELIQDHGTESLVRFYEILHNLARHIYPAVKISHIIIPDHQPQSMDYWHSLGILRQNKQIISKWEKMKASAWTKNDEFSVKMIVSSAYSAERNIQRAYELLKQIQPQVRHFFYSGWLTQMVFCLRLLKKHDEVVAMCQRYVQGFPMPAIDMNLQLTILNSCADSQLELGQREVALSTFLKPLKIDEKTLSVHSRNFMMNIHNGIGRCYKELGLYEKAIIPFKNALTKLDRSSVKRLAIRLGVCDNLHKCYKSLGKREEALKYWKLANEIYQQLSEAEKQAYEFDLHGPMVIEPDC